MPKRSNLKGPGKCIFCGSGGMSKEHVWSEWTYELVPKLKDAGHQRVVMKSSKHNPHITGVASDRTYQGATNTIKIKCVCERDCNNGWMSRMETAAKPILTPLILGQPAIVSKDEARTVAAWAAMKMMVTEFSIPEDVVSTQQERTH
jgi:hypothetical protein